MPQTKFHDVQASLVLESWSSKLIAQTSWSPVYDTIRTAISISFWVVAMMPQHDILCDHDFIARHRESGCGLKVLSMQEYQFQARHCRQLGHAEGSCWFGVCFSDLA